MREFPSPSEAKIAFLDLLPLSEDAVRGGALVTDHLSEPLEFRCTDPVQPSKLQRTFWGARLKGHLTAKVIGKPLVEALSSRPDLIVVRHSEFVELRGEINQPLVLLSREDESVEAVPIVGDDLCRVSTAGNESATLLLRAHRQFQADLEPAEATLSLLCQSTDLFEPFIRVTTALKLIHDQQGARTR